MTQVVYEIGRFVLMLFMVIHEITCEGIKALKYYPIDNMGKPNSKYPNEVVKTIRYVYYDGVT